MKRVLPAPNPFCGMGRALPAPKTPAAAQKYTPAPPSSPRVRFWSQLTTRVHALPRLSPERGDPPPPPGWGLGGPFVCAALFALPPARRRCRAPAARGAVRCGPLTRGRSVLRGGEAISPASSEGCYCYRNGFSKVQTAGPDRTEAWRRFVFNHAHDHLRSAG